MLKFLLFLVLARVQFSSQDVLGKIDKELISDEIPLPNKQTEVLGGADDDNWTEDDEKWLQETEAFLKGSAEELTEDDKEWMQQIKDFMKESDEDYDEHLEEIEKLIEEIESYFRKNNPEYGYYDWLYQLAKWFGGDDDFNYINKEENLDVNVDDKNDVDLNYSWLYNKGKRSNKVLSLKRFTSV